jgi:hypothetical protein
MLLCWCSSCFACDFWCSYTLLRRSIQVCSEISCLALTTAGLYRLPQEEVGSFELSPIIIIVTKFFKPESGNMLF